MNDRFTSVGVVGLGLIGGSLCRAFSAAGRRVVGVDADSSVPLKTMAAGACALAGTDPALLRECGAVFLALYPHEAVRFARKNAAVFQKGALVVDCCGIKEPVCGPLFSLAKENGFFFLGGHPMAGTEKSGFDASDSKLFEGASFLLVPGETPEPIAKEAEKLILSAGFARVVRTTPEEHDRLIAFTSQLPHVIACSYVMSPSYPRHGGFSAGSLRDVSRVAHLSPEMWSQLFLDNRGPLTAEISELIGHLEALRAAMVRGDRGELRALLQKARETHDRFEPDGADAPQRKEGYTE